MKFKQSLAALCLLAAFTSAHGANTDKMRKLLTERMPGAQIGAITKAPFGNLYEVVINGMNVFYTDAQANVAIIGKVIDLKTRKDLVEARTQDLRRVDFASLPLEHAIVSKKGDGSRKLAVFSDPDCPFCRELEKELAKVDNVTLYTFLLPIRELHPDAERKAALVWCAADRAGAWAALMLKGEEPAAGDQPCTPPLDAIRAVADKSWINGTPALVFADGRMVPGGIDAARIEQQLAAARATRPAGTAKTPAAGAAKAPAR